LHGQSAARDAKARKAKVSLLLPADLVAKWDRLIDTPYAQLTDKERESDREQVRRYLPTVAKAFGKSEP
jgi:hypothetical protein